MKKYVSSERKDWSDEEIAVLSIMYSDSPIHAICSKLNRRKCQVYNKAKSLGLKKSPEYLKGPFSSRLKIGTKRGASTQFKPGNRSWNTGKKGYQPGGRSVATRFQKGCHCTRSREVGSTRFDKDGRLLRKISSNEWVHEHVILWESVHGPVPKNHVVTFIGKDYLNIVIDNLECISRSELMRRNTIHRYPEELKQTLRLLGKVNRTIKKKHEKQN